MIEPLPKIGRNPWVGAWIAVHRVRRHWYARRAKRLPCPVISVGNLHWGGTGKTPVVGALARHWADQQRRVCILSRGYGRSSRGPIVVSQGNGPLVDVQTAGDEPFLHALDLPEVAVVVAEERYAGGCLALDALDPTPDLFLLDDGFSHLALWRNLDLLVLPAGDPWGGGRLPPGGRLREPLQASARADAILLTGASANQEDADQIPSRLEPFGFRGPAFSAATRAGQALDSSGEPIAADVPLLLVTGIARGHRVLDSARSRGLTVVDHLEFPDHYSYPDQGLATIRRRLESSGASLVLTTAKDNAKLGGRLQPTPTVLPLKTTLEGGFFSWVEGTLPPYSESTAMVRGETP